MVNQLHIKDILTNMAGDEVSVDILGSYLGYTVGKNPINPDSNLRIYFTDKTEDKNTGVMAVLAMPDLDENSNTIQIRKLYEQVINIKNNQLGSDFSVSVESFISLTNFLTEGLELFGDAVTFFTTLSINLV